MRNFRKSICMLLAGVMLCAAGCGDIGSASTPEPSAPSSSEEETSSASRQLNLIKSDVKPDPDQLLSRIKAEYLLKNNGYSNGDEVSAILSFGDNALIDGYLENEELASKRSLGEYASSVAGKKAANALAAKQDAVIRELLSEQLIKRVDYTFTTVMDAISVTTTWENFQKIEQMDGIEAILCDTFDRPKAAEDTDASAIVNAVDVYETGIFNSGSVNFTGKNTAVAVLDSGFDCSHPVFNTRKLNPNELLLTREKITTALNAKDTEGNVSLNAKETTPDLTVSDVYYSAKIPFMYDYADKDQDVFPYDSEHGTHVAGIIGGYGDFYTDKDGVVQKDEKEQNLTFKGVAYDTQLVLMKVFPDLDAGAETDDILAAVEDAVTLNVDCINMSLGAACGFAREKDGDPINRVYDKVNESGVSLITAAGNEYSSGFGGDQGNTNFVTNPDSATVGSPSTYAAPLSVASINGRKSKYLVGNKGTSDAQVVFFDESNSIAGEENDFFGELYAKMGWSLTDNAEHTLEYVTVPGVGYRTNYTGLNVTNKIALVRRGDNTFEDKALQAKNAGAAACIIYNNVDGDILMSMGNTDHIPTISISKDDGTILASKSSGTLTLSYTQEAGPFMSDYSSWGPLPSLGLKPEITAHGGNITSSVPGGGFDTISGTSMASPNMCGIVVLIRQFLKERYPNYSWKQISVVANQMLMSTASIVLNEEGMPYSPRKQGAGLASLKNVVNTKAYVSVKDSDRAKIELYDDPTRKGVYEMDFNVVNVSEKEAKYNLSLLGMTETVSSSDPEHVSESDQYLKGGFTATKSTGDGTLQGNVVTVPAGKTIGIHLVYTLTDEDKNTIDSLFPYGMYVEGFVKLDAIGEEESDIDLSVPFLAFFGDWTQAPIFDKTYYEVESEAHDAGIDEEDKIKPDYYATTPYGSILYNYIIPMGAYIYDIDTSRYDPIPSTEEHAALSNVLGALDGIYAVYAGQLRNCKTMTYTITDKLTGTVMAERVVYNSRKAFSQGGSPIPGYEELFFSTAEMGLVNNREYEFKMVGTIDYGDGGAANNVRNTFSFDFRLDDEAPIIKSAFYEKEYDKTLRKDRYYITLTVFDNQYVQSIAPIAFTSNSSYTFLTKDPIPVYGERGKECTVRFEITDILDDLKYDAILPSALGFSIDDYALNTNLYLCQLPGTDGTLKFTTDGQTDSRQLSYLTLTQGEVRDLTQYLSTTDPFADENKDFLKYLAWSTANERFVRVENGQAYAVAPGRTTVTVTERMDGRSASINILVQAANAATAEETDGMPKGGIQLLSQNDVPNAAGSSLTSVRFSYLETIYSHASSGTTNQLGDIGSRVYISSLGGPLSCYPGESFKLYYDMQPWYVANTYTTEFRSTNPTIATVSEDGTVRALKKGSATITMRVTDQNGKQSNQMATLRITVNSEFVIENRILTAYKGVGGDVKIPDDEGILYIGSFAFCLYTLNLQYEGHLPEDDYDANKDPSTNRNITSVTIPEGVTEVQRYAFYNCTALKKVTLPKSIRFVREYAFYQDAALTDINLEDVETIGAHCFDGCTLLGVEKDGKKTLDLGQMYAVGSYAFRDCTALAYLDLKALRNAGSYAFTGCTSLAQVDLTGARLSEGIFRGTGLTSVTVPDVVTVPRYAFSNCEKLTEVTLPNKTFVLEEGVFSGCKVLGKVKLQAGTKFGQTLGVVFKDTQLEIFEVDPANDKYSASGKYLTNRAGDTILFAAQKGLDDALTIDSKYTTVASSAFSGAGIASVTFQGAVNIGDYAFASCEKLTAVHFAAEGAVTVGSNAFVNCPELATVENLKNAGTVGDYAFSVRTGNGTNKIETVEVGANAKYGEGVFFRSGLQSVTIGQNATFGTGAFQRCVRLTTVNMPAEGGVTFGTFCFANDSALTALDLSNVQKIEDGLCLACTSLKSVTLSAATEIGDYAFADCGDINEITLNNNITSIGEGAFARYSTTGSAPAIRNINLPTGLTTLGDGAFLGCESLTSIAIPAGVTALPQLAFAYCTALVTATLPDTLTTIGDGAFAHCGSLTTVNLGKVKIIGEQAFVEDLQLTAIDLAAAEEVKYGAFAGSLVTGNISAPNLKKIGGFAFQKSGESLRYESIKAFSAPVLEELGEAAFQNNANLAGFVIPATLTKMEDTVFVGCTSITAFTAADGKTSGDINAYAKLVDGVLYTKLYDGTLELKSVPAGLKIDTLSVIENTSRIDFYAGCENKSITKIVLPDSLKIISNYAFYGYDKLATVEFRSVTAPALESQYSGDGLLTETDPGYSQLHGQFDLTGYDLGYFNFIDLVGKRRSIQMVLPANSDIEGYDSLIYRVYFGEVSAAQRSNYVAMEKAMREFLDYAKELESVTTVTMAKETLIDNAVTALNAVKQDPTAYGITAEEWKSYTDHVTELKSALSRLKVQNAKKAVRDVQALIDALPESYSAGADGQIENVMNAISELSLDDRSLLIQEKYSRLLAAYNAAHAGSEPSDPNTPTTPTTPQEPTEEEDGCGSVLAGSGIAAAAILLAAGAAAVALPRRKKNK